MIYDHSPVPGPDYWSFRCLECGNPVASHAGLLRRLWVRWWERW